MKTESTNHITLLESQVLRGIAILGIILHNYCHWLNGIVRENEYTFTEGKVMQLTHLIKSPIDSLFPIHILSFFGHYGVPIFLFISGYGLYVKYEKPFVAVKNYQAPTAFSFIRYHWLKLFRMLIIGFLLYLFIYGSSENHQYTAFDIIAQLGQFNNLLPNPDKVIWPGPYWYFGLMVQCYIIYRLLFFRRSWVIPVVVVVVCTILQMLCLPEGDTLNRLRYNFIGSMLPFVMGILYARFPIKINVKAYTLLLLLSFILIYFTSLNFYTWFFTPVFICIFFISLVKLISKSNTSLIKLFVKFLSWIGNISAALFIIHPLLRQRFIGISYAGYTYKGLIIYLLASIVSAWILTFIMKKIPRPKLN